jgi:hypothetical protein
MNFDPDEEDVGHREINDDLSARIPNRAELIFPVKSRRPALTSPAIQLTEMHPGSRAGLTCAWAPCPRFR